MQHITLRTRYSTSNSGVEVARAMTPIVHVCARGISRLSPDVNTSCALKDCLVITHREQQHRRGKGGNAA